MLGEEPGAPGRSQDVVESGRIPDRILRPSI